MCQVLSMGFMDKAKKMAEQAQSKLDEVQKQFNESQGSSPSQGPAVEYDQHGRPVRSEPAAEPAPPPAEAATPPHGDPVAPPPSGDEPERKDEYAPPKMTGGDPLAG
jgi:hypothetical protein